VADLRRRYDLAKGAEEDALAALMRTIIEHGDQYQATLIADLHQASEEAIEALKVAAELWALVDAAFIKSRWLHTLDPANPGAIASTAPLLLADADPQDVLRGLATLATLAERRAIEGKSGREAQVERAETRRRLLDRARAAA
jgi:hypothetical protein